MPQDGQHVEMTDGQRRRAAGRVRRVVGAQALDQLLGARDPADAVTRLLANRPELSAASVRDGLDLLEARRRDHPDGMPAEVLGRAVHRARNIVAVLVGVGVLLLVVGLLGASFAGDAVVWFEARVGSAVGPVFLSGLLVLMLVGAVLMWVGFTWRAVIAAAEARHAVRWALDRPGQVGRGLPVAEPFTPARFLAGAIVAIAWGLTALIGLFAMSLLVSDGGDYFLGTAAVAVGAGLLAAGATSGFRALGRAAAVAGEHLLLLREQRSGLRVDAATAGAQRFLLVSSASFGTFSVEERTVYPLTVELPPAELRRRHEEAELELDPDIRLVGEPDQAPLVTVESPGENDGATGRWQPSYSGGWLVASGREDSGRPAWIVVQGDPEGFAREVLPIFGDRHGLRADSLVVREPEQVPTETQWIKAWVSARGDMR